MEGIQHYHTLANANSIAIFTLEVRMQEGYEKEILI